MTRRADVIAALPVVFGLTRVEAAAAIGVSATLFDQMIADGKMPSPRQLSSARLAWDVDELRLAFKALPHREEQGATDSWDDV